MSLLTNVGRAISLKKRLIQARVPGQPKTGPYHAKARKDLADRLRAKRREMGSARARKSLTDNAHFDRSKLSKTRGY